MAFSRPTRKELYDRILADLGSRPGVDTFLRRSFEIYLAKASSGVFHGLYGFLDGIVQQVNPLTCGADVLALWCSVFAIPRKTMQKAVGVATFAGTDGSVLSSGTVVQRGDGVRYVVTTGAVVSGGTVSVPVEAETAGSDGNTSGAAQLRLASPITGIQSLGALGEDGAAGGLDLEDVEAWRIRLIERIRAPQRGGSSGDYVSWAKATPTVDVENVYVYPYFDGSGTVAITFTVNDEHPIPNADDRDAVQAYVDALRPEDMKSFRVFLPKNDPVTYEIQVRPMDAATQLAVRAALKDLHRREAVPGGKLLISHIREAISGATGEEDSVVTSPNADVNPTSSVHLLTYDDDEVGFTEITDG